MSDWLVPGLGIEAVLLPADLPLMLRSLKRAYVDAALGAAGGNVADAAKLLGLKRTTLVEMLRRRAKAERR